MGDKMILKTLAKRVADLSERPREAVKKDLWYRHNALEAVHPLIFCDPENGWHEIITEKDLACEDPTFRIWEMTLRKEIFWGESMQDDRVIEPSFCLPYIYSKSDWGMHETITQGGNGGSYSWDAPLKDYADMDKLKYPQITVDYSRTNQQLDLANDLFSEILNVQLKTSWWWTLGLTQTLVFLRGLEQIMFDMYDYPVELHKLMAFLRDGHLSMLDFLEDHNLLSLNNGNTYIGSGAFGFTDELPTSDFDGTHVRTVDMWGFGESQETSGVSPELFEEFIFPYQKTILERFGLNCYGCCEALNSRWDVIKNIPRLRRVSVSPWANIADMAEKLGDRYIFSMKPNPTDLAVPKIDESRIRHDLREALKLTKNCRVEIIMKDNHTIANNPQNVISWCRIVREEISGM